MTNNHFEIKNIRTLHGERRLSININNITKVYLYKFLILNGNRERAKVNSFMASHRNH